MQKRRIVTMNTHAAVTGIESEPKAPAAPPSQRNGKRAPLPFHFTHHGMEDEGGQRQAELFYLQKQIQSQTPMVIVLADGEHVEGSRRRPLSPGLPYPAPTYPASIAHERHRAC